MFTPRHWKTKNLLSCILYPLGCLYGLATACRIKFVKPQKVAAKVICIGNLTAGGTGKTPVAISIARLLQTKNRRPFFVTRGYGGILQDIIVEPQNHNARQVGDEPLLLARQAPVVVNHQRYLGAKKAVANGADIIIMDDGFQNPLLYKDISLLVIDGTFGLGNEFCIPAGPLREYVSLGIKRSQAIIIIGEDRFNLRQRFSHLPVFQGVITPLTPSESSSNIIAFAGIGRPEKFYQSLQDCGLNVIKTIDFPDHHFYQEEELRQIITTAEQNKAVVYTTSKDFVKIPSHLQPNFKVLEISIKWDDAEALTKFLLQ